MSTPSIPQVAAKALALKEQLRAASGRPGVHSGYFLGAVSDEEISRILYSFRQPFPNDNLGVSPLVQQGVSHAMAKPGSVQASIRLGKRCIPKANNPEYFDEV